MALGGYTKLSSSILASTVWREPNETRIVWITMLALANAQGAVEASVPGLADLARVPLAACEEALQALQQPDPYSRTKDHEGRRIEPVDGGWLLLNYDRYRERVSTDERREYLRIKKQESRDRARGGQQGVNTGQQMSTMSTQAEAEAEAGSSSSSKKKAKLPTAQSSRHDGQDDLQAAWNELTTAPIARVLEMNAGRRRAAAARLRERGIDTMRQVFGRIQASAFCRGDNDRHWLADFDWALKPASITKVLEGKYDGWSARSGSPSQPNSGLPESIRVINEMEGKRYAS